MHRGDTNRIAVGGRTSFSIALLLLSAMHTPLAAQGWSWSVYGGRVTHELATATPPAISALLSLQYRGATGSWAFLSTGVPFGSGEATWGAGGLGTRAMGNVGPVQVGVDLDGQAYGFRDPSLARLGTGAVVGVRPLLAAGTRAARLEIRSGWAAYGSSFGGSSFRRSTHDSDVSVHVYPAPWARLTGTLRHVRAEEDSYSFGGGQLTLALGRLQAWGGVGGWTSDALPTVPWNAGGAVALDQAERTRVVMAIRRDATDPLHWNTPRSRWSVGVTQSLGGGRRAPAAERPLIVMKDEESTGQHEFRLPVGDARGRPSIAGEFTDWKPLPMTREGDEWVARVRLQPGVYRYAFRTESGEWFVPESTPGRRADGMGGFVAVLIVS